MTLAEHWTYSFLQSGTVQWADPFFGAAFRRAWKRRSAEPGGTENLRSPVPAHEKEEHHYVQKQ